MHALVSAGGFNFYDLLGLALWARDESNNRQFADLLLPRYERSV